MKLLIVVAIFIACSGLVFLSLRGSAPLQPADRLRAHLAVRHNVSVYLSADGTTWERATLNGGRLQVRGVDVADADLERFVIAYPSGAVLDTEGVVALPAGTHFMADAAPATFALRPQDVVTDPAFVTVAFEASPTHPHDASYYRTSLTNQTATSLRVVRFAAFQQQGDTWVLATANGGFYGPVDFDDWYETSNGLLPPGQRMSDPTNYGARPVLWAWEVEDTAGVRTWVGGVW